MSRTKIKVLSAITLSHFAPQAPAFLAPKEVRTGENNVREKGWEIQKRKEGRMER